jgi:hypothetical protein
VDLTEHLDRFRDHHSKLKELIALMTDLSDEVAATVTLLETAAATIQALAESNASLEAQVAAQATQIADEATEVENLTTANATLQAAIDAANASTTPPADGSTPPADTTPPATTPEAPAFADTPIQLSSGLGVSASLAAGASGGTPSYQFSNPAGDLPTGLSMDASGNLTGTAPAAGTYPVTIEVTDSTGATGTGTETITVV